MNQQEFKQLDKKFFDKLGEELAKVNASYQVMSKDIMTGNMQVGIYFNEIPDRLEVYNYQNNGDVASYGFAGYARRTGGNNE